MSVTKNKNDLFAVYDAATLGKAKKLKSGFLRAPVTLTKTGVFPYVMADGTVIKQLRHPKDVFHEESLDSLRMAPVTRNHPPPNEQGSRLVTLDNIADLAVGYIGDSLITEAKHIKGTILITDKEAIKEIEAGDARQVSCGYLCALDWTEGEYEGEKYDCRQHLINYNHVATTPQGRMGPDVQINLDSGTCLPYQVTADSQTKPKEKEKKMAKLTIGKVEYECSDQLDQAFHAFQESLDEKIKALIKEKDTLQAKLDQAAEEEKKLKERLDSATDTAKVRAAMKARIALEGTAEKFLGKEESLDALSDLEIQKKIITKVSPEIDLSDKSADYVAARYDSILEHMDEGEPGEGVREFEQVLDQSKAGDKDKPDAWRTMLADAWKENFSGNLENLK